MRTIGKYQISRSLGRNGSSPLYEATDTVLGRRVALRTLAPSLALNPQRRARFFEAAAATARLRHPYIAKIYDVGQDELEPYVVMEAVEGTDLETLLHTSGPRSADWKVQVVTQLCEGLGYAHRHFVLHLDLRPANVYITPAGDVKIMGFGTASLRPVDFSTAELRVEEILYVSPEQIVGGALDERADIFSVGAVAYELFSGRRAFDATTVPAALEAITNGRPDPKALPPTEYSPRLESIVMKALARDALQRYQTIEEMSGDIENLVCETASLFFERMLENKDNAGAAGEIADGGAEGQREDEIQKLYSVALVQAAEGRLEEALKLTKAIRALAPGDPRNDEMMSYLGEMKDRETAQALLATAVEHVALGNLQEAEASIKESLALYAHDPQAQALWRTLERVKATPPDLTELQAPPTAPVPLNGRTRAVPVASGVKTDPLANTALDRFLRALTVDPRDKRAEELKGILGALGPGARDPTSTQRDS